MSHSTLLTVLRAPSFHSPRLPPHNETAEKRPVMRLGSVGSVHVYRTAISVLASLLTLSFIISVTSGHRSHLPSTFHPSPNAQPSSSPAPLTSLWSSSSTMSASTMLPHPFHSPSSFHKMANYSGDIMLGAVFPIHERDQNFSCGSIQVGPVEITCLCAALLNDKFDLINTDRESTATRGASVQSQAHQ